MNFLFIINVLKASEFVTIKKLTFRNKKQKQNKKGHTTATTSSAKILQSSCIIPAVRIDIEFARRKDKGRPCCLGNVHECRTSHSQQQG